MWNFCLIEKLLIAFSKKNLFIQQILYKIKTGRKMRVCKLCENLYPQLLLNNKALQNKQNHVFFAVKNLQYYFAINLVNWQRWHFGHRMFRFLYMERRYRKMQILSVTVILGVLFQKKVLLKRKSAIFMSFCLFFFLIFI